MTSGVSSFNAGTVLFTVADLKSLIIRVNLNEVDIAKVHVGQPVRVTLDAYPQKIFTGKVRFVAPAAELVEKIKVFKVEVALDELGDAFRTGMSANVEILGEKRDKAVSIPLEALQRRDGQDRRLPPQGRTSSPKQIADGARRASRAAASSSGSRTTGRSTSTSSRSQAGIATLERVEILAGLKAGDQVALEDPTQEEGREGRRGQLSRATSSRASDDRTRD